MKRRKDDEIEEKLMGAMGPKPMFPRLHVNDTTDRGGPRAPPRNKMALYEQLTIPSHRFPHVHNPNNTTAPSLVPPPTQDGGSERNMLSSHRVPPRHQSEKHYSQYPDSRTPVGLIEQRKEVDEDDYSVPIFVHSVPSQELCSRTNNMDREELSPSSPSPKFRHANERGAMECSSRPEAKTQKGENTKIVSVHVKSLSKCSFSDKTKELSAEPRQCSDKQNTAATNNRSSSLLLGALPAENQNIIHDPMYDLRSREDSSCRSPPTGNLERGDSVSETSVLDSLPGDITPDDVVGVIGQKHFWKARRAIANQQTVFAVQVFELHRLIKVQRLIAASPNLLHEDSAYSGEPIKASPRKKLQLDYTVKALPNISKQKIDSEKQSHKKEGSAESTVEKVHLPSSQKRSPPTPLITDSPAPSNGGDHNGRQWCHHQPRPGQQWLIPVMSPSEGLVYKPYPGPGFAGQACGGCGPPGPNPVFGNFLAPAYGFPAPPPQYQLPSYPPPGPHSYFPPYGMQIMSTSAFSGSSVEQIKPPANSRHDSAPEGSLKIGPAPIPDPLNLLEVEVQASTGSSPIERRQVNQAVEERNMLSLFPTSPAAEAKNTAHQLPGPCPHPPRVIKVVPHNARTASESVARIFRSIQEERKQYDSA